MSESSRRTALFIIDVQVDMAAKEDSQVPDAKEICNALQSILDGVREVNEKRIQSKKEQIQLVFVQHTDPDPNDPLAKGKPTWELVFQPNEEKGDWYVEKDVRNTFQSNPDLPERLRNAGIENIIISGLQTDFCVEATTLGALENGFKNITLLSDAHSTFPSDGKTLEEIKTNKEEELRQKGVKVESWNSWFSKVKDE